MGYTAHFTRKLLNSAAVRVRRKPSRDGEPGELPEMKSGRNAAAFISN
jgi:hypothetical protein